jgi:hypothetical protein
MDWENAWCTANTVPVDDQDCVDPGVECAASGAGAGCVQVARQLRALGSARAYAQHLRVRGATVHRINARRMIVVNNVVYPDYFPRMCFR